MAEPGAAGGAGTRAVTDEVRLSAALSPTPRTSSTWHSPRRRSVGRCGDPPSRSGERDTRTPRDRSLRTRMHRGTR